MRIYLLIFCLLFLAACSNNQFENYDTVYDKGVYKSRNGDDIDGWVVFRYSGGKVSFKVKLKGGIPNGKWFQFGFKDEVIQQGDYEIMKLNLYPNKIRRAQTVTFQEGEVNETYYDVILSDSLEVEEKDSIVRHLRKSVGATTDKIKFKDREF